MIDHHQIFVIAKVNDRYRCLAGVHHPGIHGAGALRTCLRLMNIFQCSENRRGLQHELQYAAKQRWTVEDQVVGDTMADSKTLADTPEDVHFPLIMTCLVVGASVDIRNAACSKVRRLPFGTPFDGVRNTDGVTIIDISNLASVRYCFVSPRGLEARYDESIPTMAPLSGATYLSAYERKPHTAYEQPLSRWTLALDQLLEDFQTVPLVDFETLDETWPRDGWSSGEFEGDQETADGPSFSEGNIGSEMPDTNGGSAGPATSDEDRATRTTRPSLRGMAMDKLPKELVKLPEEELGPVVDEAEKLFDFQRVALSWLGNHANVLKETASGIALLSRLLVGEKLVDLSKFPTLTDEEVAVLFERASLSDTVEILDLSGNHSITDIMLELISRSQSLKALYTLDTPGLTLAKTYDTIYPLSVEALYHTDFFRRNFVTDSRTQLDLQNPSDPARPVQLLFGTRNDLGTAHPAELLMGTENDLRVRAIGSSRNRELPWQSAALDIREALLRPEILVFSLSRLILHCCKSRVL
ncbi:hypothetical protein BDV97DRAFT_21465 [Delphinella strobiligena]|nr:hypothetical protein BDV97DRAFT_21465 [Delphinella strobiligena]